jgi:hypothetical protein
MLGVRVHQAEDDQVVPQVVLAQVVVLAAVEASVGLVVVQLQMQVVSQVHAPVVLRPAPHQVEVALGVEVNDRRSGSLVAGVEISKNSSQRSSRPISRRQRPCQREKLSLNVVPQLEMLGQN